MKRSSGLTGAIVSGTQEPTMFVSRLLLPAILVLTPWFSACSWGQNFTAMQKAYGGAGPAARRQFSLRNQATQPPSFADQQGNEYTAMSPDSWGHPATRRNIPQPRFSVPSYAAPTFSTAPAYSCLLYTSPSPRDATLSRMPSSA